ncbi:Repeat domain-containing protein [Nonomuraea solani]|uniref:Repeat domain-containing protein n=1 Tax=Nonomuraea solani TaxID=1144553 RepID=A0A1H5Y4U1_9ACTN|nr:FG-GAP-like repeat-containing protein [Nonomuraea solani]SEG18852.1 Repeat domain-containing protein [Nonomuraea solani]
MFKTLALTTITALTLTATPAMADPQPTRASDVTAAYDLAACDPKGTTATDAALATRLNGTLQAKMRGYMSAYRVSCARMVVKAVRDRGLDPHAAVIAITTTIVETSIQNISEEVDHDSLGLFQQRASWGSRAQRLDPVWATNAFLDKMLRLYPGNSWRTAPVGEVCQAVQVSAYPSRYQPQAGDAQLIVNALLTPTGGQEPDDATGEAVDFDGDGKPDLLGTTADGTLRVYRGTGSPGRPSVDAGTTIGSGWNSITRITVADIDNDGKNDLVGRGADGGLYAYLNKGSADFSGTRVTIGSGWEGITRVVVGDFNDDGKTDLLGQSTDGTLYAYLNTGTPGAPNISTRVLVGTGWDGIARVLVADADNDGKTDVIGQSADGTLYAYLNTGAPNFANRVQIGTGWDGVSLVSTADIDGDDKTDVLARHGDGTLSAYLNKGVPGAPDISDRRQIGTGWNSVDRLTFADMDADGRTDVVGRFTDGTLNTYLAKGAADISTTVTIGSGWQGITRLAVVN